MGRPRKCLCPDEARDKIGRCKPCRNENERKRYDPTKERQRKESWRVNNPGVLTERSRRWRAAHPDRDKELKNRWAREHPENGVLRRQRRRARELGSVGSHTNLEWREIVERQGSQCAFCGLKTRLERDHIVPLARGGSNYASNLQGLCRSCNARKGAREDFHQLQEIA